MEAKKQLAFRIVDQFHDRSAAQVPRGFQSAVAKRDLDSAELPKVRVASSEKTSFRPSLQPIRRVLALLNSGVKLAVSSSREVFNGGES
jgi:hypothetical protein